MQQIATDCRENGLNQLKCCDRAGRVRYAAVCMTCAKNHGTKPTSSYDM